MELDKAPVPSRIGRKMAQKILRHLYFSVEFFRPLFRQRRLFTNPAGDSDEARAGIEGFVAGHGPGSKRGCMTLDIPSGSQQNVAMNRRAQETSDRMKFFLVFISFLITSVATSVSANDSVARVAAGGIILLKSPDIKMVEEVLEISQKRIWVNYRFLNESTEDIRAKVAFPMPSYSWSPESLNVGPMQDFSVTVNDVSVPTQRIRKAVLKKRDITEKLRAIGLTDFQMFEDFGGNCNLGPGEMEVGCGLTKEQRKKIAQLLGEKDYYPTWEVEETYLWDQTFITGKEIKVKHEYSPFMGGRYAYLYWQGKQQYSIELPVARSKVEACVDGSTTGAVEKKVQALLRKGAKSVRIYQSDVEYILGTGRNWKGPIDRFILRIHKATPDEIVSLCMSGKPKRINDTTIEFVQTQYVPQDRLVVYFYSVTAE